MKKKIIIGITGTLGAGKGTVVEYLKKIGFKHFSVRYFISQEIEKRKMPLNRDSMVIVANELRKKNGASYIIEELYKQAEKESGNFIIESIRTVGEANFLKSKPNSYLLAVDANPKTRFERIKKRGSETDKVNYETFIENEKRENVSAKDDRQNLIRCISLADYVLNNDGNLEDLNQQVKKIISSINETQN